LDDSDVAGFAILPNSRAVITRFIDSSKITIFDSKYGTAATDSVAYAEDRRRRFA
jgi:hypothetical protein